MIENLSKEVDKIDIIDKEAMTDVKYHIIIDLEKYTNLRRELHKIPELKYQEFETKKKVLETIKNFKNYNKLIIVEAGKTGFWVDLYGEGADEKTKLGIGFRAELDALPLLEKTDVPYKSIYPGRAHSCGHDGHMSILLCFMEYVLDDENRLKKIPKKSFIRFIFQPAEEVGRGAVQMMNLGCLKGISQIYAVHNSNYDDLGNVSIKTGAVMSSMDKFFIEITQRPSSMTSPLNTACDIVQKLNSITSQYIDSGLRSVLTIGMIQSSIENFDQKNLMFFDENNIYPKKAIIQGTIRTFDNDSENKIKNFLIDMCDGISIVDDNLITVNIENGTIVTFNDENLTNNITLPAIKKAGFTNKPEFLPFTYSDDFSYYQAKIPGVYIQLATTDSNHTVVGHSPYFDFNDLAIPYGVEIFVRLVEVAFNVELIDK